MLVKWLSTLLRRTAVKSRRRALEAEFHKNTHNTLRRVMVGLELITEPLEYNGSTYMPMSLRGRLELRIGNFGTLLERLEFFISEYNRVSNSNLPNQRWLELPEALDRKGESSEPRWLDHYFGTSDPEMARDKLRRVFVTLDLYQRAFDKQTPEQDTLYNQTAHIFRELEIIVEHYL